jgi:hypothetical protein
MLLRQLQQGDDLAAVEDMVTRGFSQWLTTNLQYEGGTGQPNSATPVKGGGGGGGDRKGEKDNSKDSKDTELAVSGSRTGVTITGDGSIVIGGGPASDVNRKSDVTSHVGELPALARRSKTDMPEGMQHPQASSAPGSMHGESTSAGKKVHFAEKRCLPFIKGSGIVVPHGAKVGINKTKKNTTKKKIQ